MNMTKNRVKPRVVKSKVAPVFTAGDVYRDMGKLQGALYRRQQEHQQEMVDLVNRKVAENNANE